MKPKVFVSELGEAIGVKLSTSNMGSLIGDKGAVIVVVVIVVVV